ncbi:hypothetical protein JZ751_016367 [Albula glossodonta]|uniref:Uncharacterized protein n=1 Tax=Albula glossodonta TaxID=121402 RepID=A0A8T2NY21_9TELE|nr:hypothetical protein JZ751_016367 [Albula glossodonta]
MPGHNTTVKPGGSSKIPWVGFGSWASNPTGLQDQLPGRALSVYLLARLIIRTDSVNLLFSHRVTGHDTENACA